MSITTVAQAKAQSRVTHTAEDALIQGYLDAAEYYAAMYQGRTIVLTPEAAANLSVGATALILDALSVQRIAIAAAASLPYGPIQTDAISAANDAFDFSYAAALRDRYAMGITPVFVQATLMMVASWYVNRETVITEFTQAIEIPFGAKNLLDLDRTQMGA